MNNNMSQSQNPIPVTVITGFLGSGKTTLLSSLLKKKEMKNTAVIINEFGEVGLDHALIERSNENVVELQNGCICCTIRGDLHKTLLQLVDKVELGIIPPFDRVVIETTGLADPIPIIHVFMTSPDLQRVYTLDGVITLVDAVNGENTLETQQESVRQVALAERIILSKTDLVDSKTQNLLIKRLKAINPAVTILPGNRGNVPVSALFGLGSYDPYNKSRDVKEWLAAEEFDDHHHDHEDDHHHHHHHHQDVNRHGDDIQAFALVSDIPVNMVAFGFFLDLLASQLGPDLLRVKGIINVAGEDLPVVIHGVQHVFHPLQSLEAWPDEDKLTKLVFITRNIQKEQVEAFFNTLMGAANEITTPEEAVSK